MCAHTQRLRASDQGCRPDFFCPSQTASSIIAIIFFGSQNYLFLETYHKTFTMFLRIPLSYLVLFEMSSRSKGETCHGLRLAGFETHNEHRKIGIFNISPNHLFIFPGVSVS